MDAILIMAYSFLLFIGSMMCRDLAGGKDRKGKIYFVSIIIVAAVVICVMFPWEHWWHAVAWIVAVLLFGWLTHYVAT